MLPEIKTIIYATDLGKHTRPVFRMANSLAKQYGAKVIIVHALEPMGSYGQALIDTYLPKETTRAMREEGNQKVMETIKARVEKFCQEELDTTPEECDIVKEVVVRESAPAQLVLDVAKENNVDLIVMGSHGHSTLGEVLLGSAAHSVMQKSTIPVLLVPTGKD